MSTDPSSAPVPVSADRQKANQWAMVLHLSQFAAYALPIAGLIVPILVWQFKKAEFPELETHGRNVVNWIISLVIYFVVAGVLSLVFIGIPIAIALAAVAIIFPIIGALKASNGEAWKYPLSIAFLK